MDFRKAGEIARQNPGSTVVRNPSGSFVVRCQDGALIGSDGVATSHVSMEIKKGNKSLQPKNNVVARLSERQLKNIENNIPKNNGLPWSKEAEKMLLASFDAGDSLDDMAKFFERKVTSVIARLEKFGLISSETSVVLAPIPSKSATPSSAPDKRVIFETTKSRKKRTVAAPDRVTAAVPALQSKVSKAKSRKKPDKIPSKTDGKKIIEGQLVLLPPGRRRTGRDVAKKDHADKIAEWSNENIGTDISGKDVKAAETISTVVGTLFSIFTFF